jgi:hypothetical protein
MPNGSPGSLTQLILLVISSALPIRLRCETLKSGLIMMPVYACQKAIWDVGAFSH